MELILNLAGAFAVIVVVFFLGILPRNLSNSAGEWLGTLAYRAMGRWRRVALNNLTNVYGGSVEGPARAVFTHLGRSLAELSRLVVGRTDPLAGIRTEGYGHFEKALSDGKGVILVTGHCGNWELMAQFVAFRHPITIVARRINNPFLHSFFGWFRSRTGNRFLSKEGALREILKRLRAGEAVGMLMDQGVVESEGVEIDFLDHPAWVMKIPALVAMKTGATVLPAFIHRRADGGHTIVIEPPVEVTVSGDSENDLRVNTMRFSASVERYVRQYPDQWLWIHRRWKRAAEEVWGKP